ncbi:RrF2 family transcriptional regulator [Aestuariispira insulae]|nr:Rrf2 family transcriptional regulator [Aestuariispira insulae]
MTDTNMRHTVFTDYCLRVLIFTGARGERLSTIDDISKAYGISRNHLMKVVHRLGQEGYVETIRGRSGGIRLARAPEHINIGELISRVEEDFHLVECFNEKQNHCVLMPACKLNPILHEALEAYFSVLRQYRLSDLLCNRQALETLLYLRDI